MNRYLPLLMTFLIFAGVTGTLFLAVWGAWAAPRRIRRAVRSKWSPRQIRAAVKTSYVYWLLILPLALVTAGVVAYLCWWYLGFWLYAAAGDWQDRFATVLNQTLWVWVLPNANLEYSRIIPLGVVFGALLGVYIGSILGTWLGTKLAARRFLITRLMF